MKVENFDVKSFKNDNDEENSSNDEKTIYKPIKKSVEIGGYLNSFTTLKDKEIIDKYGKTFLDFFLTGSCVTLPMFTYPPEPKAVKRITIDKSIVIQPGNTTYLYLRPFAPTDIMWYNGTSYTQILNAAMVEPFINFKVVCAKCVIKQVGIMSLNDGYGTVMDAVMCSAQYPYEYLTEALLSVQVPPGRRIIAADGRDGIQANFVGSPEYSPLYQKATAFKPNYLISTGIDEDHYIPGGGKIFPATSQGVSPEVYYLGENNPTFLTPQTILTPAKTIKSVAGLFIGQYPEGEGLFVRISPPSIQITCKVYLDMVVEGPLKLDYITNMPQYIPSNAFDFKRVKYAIQNLVPGLQTKDDLSLKKMYAATDLGIKKLTIQEDLEKKSESQIFSDIWDNLKREGFDIEDSFNIPIINNSKKKLSDEDKAWRLCTKLKREKHSKEKIKKSKRKNAKKLKRLGFKHPSYYGYKPTPSIDSDFDTTKAVIAPQDFQYIEEEEFDMINKNTPERDAIIQNFNWEEDKKKKEELFRELIEKEEDPDEDEVYYAMDKEKKQNVPKKEEKKKKKEEKPKKIARKFENKANANLKEDVFLPKYIEKAITFAGWDITSTYMSQENNRLFRDGTTPTPFVSYQYFPVLSKNGKVVPSLLIVKNEKDEEYADSYTTITVPVENEKKEIIDKEIVFYYCSEDFENPEEFLECLDTVIEFVYSNNSHYAGDDNISIKVFSPAKIEQTSYMLALTLALTGAPSGGYYTGSYAFDQGIYVPNKMDKNSYEAKADSTNPNCPLVVLSSDVPDGAYSNILSGYVPNFLEGKMIPSNDPKVALMYGLLPFSLRMYKDTPLKYLQQTAKKFLTTQKAEPYRKYIVVSNLIRNPIKLQTYLTSGDMNWRDFSRTNLSRYTGIYHRRRKYITANEFYDQYPALLEDESFWWFKYKDTLFVDSAKFAGHVRDIKPKLLKEMDEGVEKKYKELLYSIRGMNEQAAEKFIEGKAKELEEIDVDLMENLKNVTFRQGSDRSLLLTENWKIFQKEVMPFYKVLKKLKNFVNSNWSLDKPKAKIWTNNKQASVLGMLNIKPVVNNDIPFFKNEAIKEFNRVVDALSPQGTAIVAFAAGWPEMNQDPIISNEVMTKLLEKYKSLKVKDFKDEDYKGAVIPKAPKTKRGQSVQREPFKEKSVLQKVNLTRKKYKSPEIKKKKKKDDKSDSEESKNSDSESDSITYSKNEVEQSEDDE